MGRKREREVARTVALPYDITLHMIHVHVRVGVCMRLMGSRGISGFNHGVAHMAHGAPRHLGPTGRRGSPRLWARTEVPRWRRVPSAELAKPRIMWTDRWGTGNPMQRSPSFERGRFEKEEQEGKGSGPGAEIVERVATR